MKSILKVTDFDVIEILVLNNKPVLLLKQKENTKYLSLPESLNYKLISEGIEITCLCLKYFEIYNTFLNIISEIKNVKNSYYKKKLLLKGLGYRCNVDLSTNTLVLKLGFSHIINIKIPEYIKNIVVKKTFLFIESNDKILLGNFIDKIHSLKISDIYKGKGFSYQYEQRKLKVIKKK